MSSTKNPRGLSESAYWETIGDNLCSLALLVGADVSRGPEDIKSKSIVVALREAANDQGRAITVMLTRLEKQNDTFRKQQQAITALKFRRGLEMISQNGQATSRWQTFWDQAAAKAYTDRSTPPKSPLANLKKDRFEQEKKKKHGVGNPFSQTQQIEWLINETNISQRAKALYSTLSKVIHKYSPDKFSVDSLKYGPYVKLLEAIKT